MPFMPEHGVSAAESGSDLPVGYTEAFASSMPSRYAVLFDPRSIRRHAAVAYRRGGRPAHAEVWRSLPDAAALCVVAEDRPGLLSAIAAALVSHRLDVITALVFSRVAASGEHEAVDLLWVRRATASDTVAIGAEEAVSISEVLSAILSGSISVEDIASRPPKSAHPDDDVVVRFEEADEDGQAVLRVEAADRPGMLLTIAFEVFQQGAQIVRSLVRTADSRAFNRFVLAEFSGAPLSPERRKQICAAVFAALALQEPG
jgi:[protein-PII] uridylyltransferase